jgi:hypothetical protein
MDYKMHFNMRLFVFELFMAFITGVSMVWGIQNSVILFALIEAAVMFVFVGMAFLEYQRR